MTPDGRRPWPPNPPAARIAERTVALTGNSIGLVTRRSHECEQKCVYSLRSLHLTTIRRQFVAYCYLNRVKFAENTAKWQSDFRTRMCPMSKLLSGDNHILV